LLDSLLKRHRHIVSVKLTSIKFRMCDMSDYGR